MARLPLWWGLAALALAAPAGAMQEDRVLHGGRVTGWTLETLAESDGGFMARMRRRGRDFEVEFITFYWRGNSGPGRGASLRIAGCSAGGGGSIEAPPSLLSERSVRARLAMLFRQCEASPGREAALMAGFPAAFAQFLAFDRRAIAANEADIRRIMRGGR